MSKLGKIIKVDLLKLSQAVDSGDIVLSHPFFAAKNANTKAKNLAEFDKAWNAKAGIVIINGDKDSFVYPEIEHNTEFLKKNLREKIPTITDQQIDFIKQHYHAEGIRSFANALQDTAKTLEEFSSQGPGTSELLQLRMLDNGNLEMTYVDPIFIRDQENDRKVANYNTVKVVVSNAGSPTEASLFQQICEANSSVLEKSHFKGYIKYITGDISDDFLTPNVIALQHLKDNELEKKIQVLVTECNARGSGGDDNLLVKVLQKTVLDSEFPKEKKPQILDCLKNSELDVEDLLKQAVLGRLAKSIAQNYSEQPKPDKKNLIANLKKEALLAVASLPESKTEFKEIKGAIGDFVASLNYTDIVSEVIRQNPKSSSTYHSVKTFVKGFVKPLQLSEEEKKLVSFVQKHLKQESSNISSIGSKKPGEGIGIY
jgi:hypothetical protein